MEAFTPYPADPADWPRVEQSFWGMERRTWGGGHGITNPPPGIRPPRLEEATQTPKDEGGECFFTQGRTLGVHLVHDIDLPPFVSKKVLIRHAVPPGSGVGCGLSVVNCALNSGEELEEGDREVEEEG